MWNGGMGELGEGTVCMCVCVCVCACVCVRAIFLTKCNDCVLMGDCMHACMPFVCVRVCV